MNGLSDSIKLSKEVEDLVRTHKPPLISNTDQPTRDQGLTLGLVPGSTPTEV